MSHSPKALREIFQLFGSVKSAKEAELLLRDILTPQEVDVISERWQLVQALATGHTHRRVAKECGVSISKVTRGAHELQFGPGGFCYFLKKMKKPVRKYCVERKKRKA